MSAHAIRHCQQPAIALSLHLPSGKCTGASPSHPLLHRRQHPPDYSLQIQEQPTPGVSIRRYPAGSRERQPTVRGEPLAVALRTGPAPDDVHRGGGGCQAGSSQRCKSKGGGDKETPQGGGSQRGRGACGGGGLKTFVPNAHMITYMISYSCI